ncbi:GNAT family N-acetyltransferase [Fusobacterium sp.]|uniref:GNAT family N-acetyltransferase n=1 Tax=Fusobacterium sp. TaxID=68766 RepID=UPI00260A3C77|nr:N-acetyltransferase [Fusobacterium sp.]
MDIIIRKEEERDYERVIEIARDAFWDLYFPGTDIPTIINKLHKSSDLIKDLTYIIEVDGQVEGGIFYTLSTVVDSEENRHQTISFGPVFISKKFQNQGLGKKLIEYTIEKAKEQGYKGILTLGYPYHYKSYGFLGGKNYNISMPDMKFYKGLLVLPLYAEALKEISGYVLFSKDLEATPEEIEEFEKRFPYREKGFQESQLEYQKACIELDE